MISGVRNIRSQWDIWSGFEAAHVFPLEHESLWLSSGSERWIANMNDVLRTSYKRMELSAIITSLGPQWPANAV